MVQLAAALSKADAVPTSILYDASAHAEAVAEATEIPTERYHHDYHDS